MDTKQLIPPFREALEAYRVGYMAARNLAARSRKEYQADLGKFLFFLQEIGVESLERVGANHVEAYLADLDRQALAGVTRRRKLVIIRTFFDWLKNNGQLQANPAQKVVPPQREEREPRVLSKEEYQRLLAVVQRPRDRAIIQLLLQTGIRLAEIQRLTQSDLDLPKRVTKDALGTMRILGKGRKTRTVLLNTKACEAPAAWLAVRPDVEPDALFVSSRNQPLSASSLSEKCHVAAR